MAETTEVHVLKADERFPRSGQLTLFFEAILIDLVAFALLFSKIQLSRGDQRTAAIILGVAAFYFIFSAVIIPKIKWISVIKANTVDSLVNILTIAAFVYLTGGPQQSIAFPLLFIVAMFVPSRVSFNWAVGLNSFLAGVIVFLYMIESSPGANIFAGGAVFQALAYLTLIAAFADAIGREVTNSFSSYFAKAAEISRLKDEFTFIAAHELRSPVTAIRGYTSMFEGGDFGDLSIQAQHAVGVIHEAVERLNTLVDDLLDVSRIEARRLRLSIEELDVVETVNAMCDALQAKAKSFSHTLTCTVEGQHKMKADALRIKEVLTNLVDNAIKYTPAGGTISCTARVHKDAIEISVRDSGLGIPEEAKPHIFERFYRVPRKGEQIEGTGLGLFITKHLIEAMGGSIGFESEVGKGTTFTFTIPRAQNTARSEERRV